MVGRVVQQLFTRGWLSCWQQRRSVCALARSSLLERTAEVRPTVPLPPTVWGLFQLMAVPKRKVSRSKKGIRNGPKALKPQPVIIRCKSCGRVKLPHFYCCSGQKRGE